MGGYDRNGWVGIAEMRKGELIFRYIYSYLNCKKPFYRLWISSLTDKAIKDGLQNLKNGGYYDKLFYAAKARSEADWLVGINASQALSIAAGRGVFSLGRVQTPTLAMICRRFLDNKNFTPVPFWQIKIQTEKANVPFAVISREKYDSRDTANSIFGKLQGNWLTPNAVSQFSITIVAVHRSLPFSRRQRSTIICKCYYAGYGVFFENRFAGICFK